ncbi:FliH/SctL family protein [Schlesneria paludicola]|uniref:FliH/SctL family protein n=1 Tax=Schlesneria paludicola TaxID=360056 RepID=UPI00029B1458|nr:FliH/SctL family protein [Schlesneria paludicola]
MSARIIKASEVRQVREPGSYNLVDFRLAAEQLTEVASREASAIVEAAHREAHEIRERAAGEARTSGLDEGMREATEAIHRQASEIAETQITEQLSTALPALQNAAALLREERDRWIQRWEQTAVRISVAIAEKLLQRQLESRPGDAKEMIAAALRLAVGQPQLTIHLNSADLGILGDRAVQVVQSLTACGETTIVSDAGMTRGGCRIETRHGEIDATIETMLGRIADELMN